MLKMHSVKSGRQTPQLWRKRGGVVVRSDDGVIEFRLEACDAGLYVERAEERDHRGRVVQSTIFSDAATFRRWCDADMIRFEYPVVYMSLKRNGDNVLC